MPRPIEWLQRLPSAVDALQKLTTPVVSREMLAQLLGVHRRTAIRLMHRFGGYVSGNSYFIARPELIAKLEKVSQDPLADFERGRRERFEKNMEILIRESRGRSVKVPVAADVWTRQVAGLPATVKLIPGKLEITCTDPQDLLRQLMEVAQAAGNDYESFEMIVLGKVE